MSAYLIGYRSKLISLITKRSSYWIIVHKALIGLGLKAGFLDSLGLDALKQ